MRAIRVHRFGGPEQLIVEQVPRPQPRQDEVLVNIRAVGVLPAEWRMRQGLFRSIHPVSFPYIPGSAFAGVVVEAGAGASDFAPGQGVFGRTNNGAYAEYTTASVETVAVKPEHLGFDEAATISGGATTAWTALFDPANGALQPGQRVLIHGGAGGVGLFAVQLARWKGAHVIATASAGNLEFVRSLGAEEVIDYSTTPFEQVARDVDLVLDTIGGETLRRSMRVVRPGGVLVSLLEQPAQEEARERGIRAVTNSVSQPYPSRDLLESIAHLMEEGTVRTLVGATFPLHEAPLAHELSQSGHGRGRIILHPGDE